MQKEFLNDFEEMILTLIAALNENAYGAAITMFGMSSHMIIQRTKEIGIRKMLGASLMNILRLLSGYYLKLVLIAFVLVL